MASIVAAILLKIRHCSEQSKGHPVIDRIMIIHVNDVKMNNLLHKFYICNFCPVLSSEVFVPFIWQHTRCLGYHHGHDREKEVLKIRDVFQKEGPYEEVGDVPL